LIDVLENSWTGICQGDPEHLQAAAFVNQRSFDEALLPIVDMINHRNGKRSFYCKETASELDDLTF